MQAPEKAHVSPVNFPVRPEITHVRAENSIVTPKNPIVTCRNGSAIGSYANVWNLQILPLRHEVKKRKLLGHSGRRGQKPI